MAGASPVKIVTTVWDRLQRQLKLNSRAGQESHVKVGCLASQGGDAAAADGGISMIELWAIHEFGSPAAGIPQRSSIRSTFNRDSVRGEMRELTGKLVTQVIHGMRLERALGLLGAWGTAQIKNTVKQRLTTGPEAQANKPATIKRKGSDLPLVDTGRMLASLAWKVWIGRERNERGQFTGGAVDL